VLSPIRIYLIRHAQSAWQVRASEDWDTALTAMGHEQARCLARWLATCPEIAGGCRVEVSSLYASPFKRARETASYISDALGLDITTHDALSEARFHVASRLPQAKGPFEQDRESPPACRDYVEFQQQAESALRFLVGQAEAVRGPVLAVTHGGLIKTLLRSVVGSDRICFRLFNACVNVIEWQNGRWHLVHLNLWDHLIADLRTR
jgi:broad specificity phosphatase PhoE